jgi:hypothetical protein
MGSRYGINRRHGLSASFGSKLLEVVSTLKKKGFVWYKRYVEMSSSADSFYARTVGIYKR